MIKEIKYLIFITIIITFLFLTVRYYFSDKNKKNSYRSSKLYNNKIIKYKDDLITLESDTENIIEYVENNLNKENKKYKFWELINNDKK